MVPLLRDHKHEVYDFKNPPNGVKGFAWSDVNLTLPCKAEDYRHALETHPRAAQGFMNDLRAMLWADTCVLLLPCGRSAHLEAGYMAGLGKRTIILTQDGEEPELMALLAHHICISPEEVLALL
jgi:nucleoside 2-deoxyribosyltransferase